MFSSHFYQYQMTSYYSTKPKHVAKSNK